MTKISWPITISEVPTYGGDVLVLNEPLVFNPDFGILKNPGAKAVMGDMTFEVFLGGKEAAQLLSGSTFTQEDAIDWLNGAIQMDLPKTYYTTRYALPSIYIHDVELAYGEKVVFDPPLKFDVKEEGYSFTATGEFGKAGQRAQDYKNEKTRSLVHSLLRANLKRGIRELWTNTEADRETLRLRTKLLTLGHVEKQGVNGWQPVEEGTGRGSTPPMEFKMSQVFSGLPNSTEISNSERGKQLMGRTLNGLTGPHNSSHLQTIIFEDETRTEVTGLWSIPTKGGQPIVLKGPSLKEAIALAIEKADLADTTRPSFVGAIFQNADLSCLDLDKVNLEGAVFRDCDLVDMSARNANFSGVTFQDCGARGAQFWKANLTKANFQGGDFTHASLHDADLEGATGGETEGGFTNFTEALFGTMGNHEERVALGKALIQLEKGVSLAGSCIEGVSFAGATLENMDFGNVDFEGCDFEGATLKVCNFAGAKLSDPSLEGSHWVDCNLTNASLLADTDDTLSMEGTHWVRTTLEGAHLQGVDFSKASEMLGVGFECATLQEVKFNSATLTDTRFEEAKLRDVRFDGTNFEGVVTFANAFLYNCDFSSAKLPLSIFTDARFNRTIFQGAAFDEVFKGGANWASTDVHENASFLNAENFTEEEKSEPEARSEAEVHQTVGAIEYLSHLEAAIEDDRLVDAQEILGDLQMELVALRFNQVSTQILNSDMPAEKKMEMLKGIALSLDEPWENEGEDEIFASPEEKEALTLALIRLGDAFSKKKAAEVINSSEDLRGIIEVLDLGDGDEYEDTLAGIEETLEEEGNFDALSLDQMRDLEDILRDLYKMVSGEPFVDEDSEEDSEDSSEEEAEEQEDSGDLESLDEDFLDLIERERPRVKALREAMSTPDAPPVSSYQVALGKALRLVTALRREEMSSARSELNELTEEMDRIEGKTSTSSLPFLLMGALAGSAALASMGKKKAPAVQARVATAPVEETADEPSEVVEGKQAKS